MKHLINCHQMTPLTEQAKSQAACNRQQILCRLARSHTPKKKTLSAPGVSYNICTCYEPAYKVNRYRWLSKGGRKQTLSEIYQSHTTAPSEWHTEYRMEFDELKRFIGNVVSLHTANDERRRRWGQSTSIRWHSEAHTKHFSNLILFTHRQQ